ncbi:MAG: hypothetical protein IPJ99_00950 [Betaproteobacteria bacterium]|nr:hypothetical protein [Betaproteobacteria bacterium]
MRDAVEVVTKLIDKLAEPYPLGEHTLHIGVSAGIALFPETDRRSGRSAALRRHRHVQARRRQNDYCIYLGPARPRQPPPGPGKRPAPRHRQEEFFLMYQPGGNPERQDRRPGGLVRWQHPERGVLPRGTSSRWRRIRVSSSPWGARS